MFEFSEASLLAFFTEYAYRPGYVYAFVTLFMLASSFGLPIPEELVLITAGLVAHIATDKVAHPPPYPEAVGVDVLTLSIVCFFAVFLSDLLVFLIGKYFGVKIIKSDFFRRKVDGNIFQKVNEWFRKYGALSCGIFRFTPGLRFFGHMSCGLLGIPISKFILIDGAAILISVPTQVYFVATYGNVVLEKIRDFKYFVLILAAAALVFYVLKKLIKKRNNKNGDPTIQ